MLLISCEPDDCKPDEDKDGPVVYKPNIYLYPQQKEQLSVQLTFPQGGKVIKSIPEYKTGWNVTVDKNGLIDNQYTYLFYESVQPNIWQNTLGWMIEKDKLKAFFEQNLSDYGFKNNEISDFTEYWIPRFSKYNYYVICPQVKKEIEQVIKLNISKKPDNVLRLFYTVKGYDKKPTVELQQPAIDVFERKGFFVTEWGVILR